MTVTTLTYTGAVQDVTIAAGIYAVQIEWWGAQGGTSLHGGVGGKGGYTKGTFLVSPGMVLHNNVGGQGVSGSTTGAGGWNGGGNSHAIGGGVSTDRKSV